MRLIDLICFLPVAYAFSIPFEVWTGPSKSEVKPHRLHRRDTVSLKNIANSVYVGNVTLSNRTVPVLLDTGSSDLWVTGDVPGATDSGKSVELEYAVGTASGDIYYADMKFAGYSVDDQAFLLVEDTSTFSTNITAQGYSGLMGLGPNTGSLIRKKIDSDSFEGDAVLDRIYQLNKTEQNYITFMLDRKNDPGSNITGQFTVSSLISGYENVTNQPQLSIVTVPGLTDRDQHWQMYTDVDGITGPDGEAIKYDSIVSKAPDGKLVAVVDSGFTLPQVPRQVSDAIYGRVQGAEWNADNAVWTIPCGQILNISFSFGGVKIPIHPLDTSSSDFHLTDSNGNTVCVGTFQPITSAFSLLGEYDLILGMGFLRNTYTLIDLGNFVEGSSKGTHAGYTQLLPLTDVNAAHQDFVNVRLGGEDTTGDSQYALLPASEGQSSPVSSAEKKAILAEKVLGRWPYILMGALILFFIIVGYIIWRCCFKRRWEEKKKAKAAKLAGGSAAAATAAMGNVGSSRNSAFKNAGKRLSQSLQMNTLRSPGMYQQLEDPSPTSHNTYSPHSPNSFNSYQTSQAFPESYSSQSLVSPHPYSSQAQNPPDYHSSGGYNGGYQTYHA